MRFRVDTAGNATALTASGVTVLSKRATAELLELIGLRNRARREDRPATVRAWLAERPRGLAVLLGPGCFVCARDDRQAADEELQRGHGLGSVAGRHGLSVDSLWLHRRHR